MPAALGSDGLGSVRVPAAWAHLVGIKPQRGRISTWPDAESFNGLTCIGPLARTVPDAASLLDAAAGSHAGDRHRPEPPAEPFAATAERADPGRRLRVALSLRSAFAPVPRNLDPAVRAQVERIAAAIEALGHAVVLAEPSYGVFGAGVLPRSIGGVATWVERIPDRELLDRADARGRARWGACCAGRCCALDARSSGRWRGRWVRSSAASTWF